MKKRVFLSMFLMSMLTFIFTAICTTGILYNDHSEELKNAVRSEAEYIGNAVENFYDNEQVGRYLSEAGGKSINRITYMDSKGIVCTICVISEAIDFAEDLRLDSAFGFLLEDITNISTCFLFAFIFLGTLFLEIKEKLKYSSE